MELQQHDESNNSHLNRGRPRIRRSSEEISIIRRQQAAERNRTYRERIRTNCNVNAHSVEIVVDC